MFVKLERIFGELYAIPLHEGSNLLGNIVKVNSFIITNKDRAIIKKGEKTLIFLFRKTE